MTHRHRQAVIYLLVIIAAASANYVGSKRNDRRLADAQVASCQRVNLLRQQFNNRGVAVHRFASVLATHDPALAAAAARLAAGFKTIPPVDCETVARAAAAG